MFSYFHIEGVKRLYQGQYWEEYSSKDSRTTYIREKMVILNAEIFSRKLNLQPPSKERITFALLHIARHEDCLGFQLETSWKTASRRLQVRKVLCFLTRRTIVPFIIG